MVRDQNLINTGYSKAGENVENIAGTKIDEYSVVILRDDIDIAGVSIKKQVRAQLNQVTGWGEIPVMRPIWIMRYFTNDSDFRRRSSLAGNENSNANQTDEKSHLRLPGHSLFLWLLYFNFGHTRISVNETQAPKTGRDMEILIEGRAPGQEPPDAIIAGPVAAIEIDPPFLAGSDFVDSE